LFFIIYTPCKRGLFFKNPSIFTLCSTFSLKGDFFPQIKGIKKRAICFLSFFESYQTIDSSEYTTTFNIEPKKQAMIYVERRLINIEFSIIENKTAFKQPVLENERT